VLSDLNYDLPPEEPVHAPDILPVFLGLYLLVLAFFIMLVSISTFEKVKSTAVMDSLSSTFTKVLPPTATPTDFSAKDGDVIAGEAFQEQISNIFTTAVQVDKIEVVQPGRLMRLQMPVSALFQEGKPQIRDDMLPLLDRIIASLSNRTPGLRQDMEVVIGTPVTKDIVLPIEQGLEMARVGEFARTIKQRGAPPDSISVGIKSGDPATISIWFWVRGVEESSVRFEEALQEMRKRTLTGSGAQP